MLRIAFLLCLIASSAFAQSTQTIPFRRMSEPTQVVVGATAQPTTIPAGRTNDPFTGLPLPSFYVVNPNNVWVRLKGFTNTSDCSSIGVTPTTGWLWPPGHVAVYSTQFPACVSAMAVPMPGFPITAATTYAPIELSYGPGQ
jgi:hypothetical protein